MGTRNRLRRCLMSDGAKDMRLPAAILVGAIIGVCMGMGLRSRDPPLTKLETSLLFLPGDVMLQLMKMLLLPITMSSVVVSMASMDLKTTGKIGFRALIYYSGTLGIASCLGITVSLLITPEPIYGAKGNATVTGGDGEAYPGLAFTDLVRNLFPDNLFEATFRKKVTFLQHTNGVANGSETDVDISVQTVEGMNLLGLLVFAVMLGVVIGSLGEQGKPLFNVFNALYLASIKLILIFIWYIPVGVAFLLAANVVLMDQPLKILSSFGLLFGITILCLVIHGFLVLPLIYLIVVRRNPFKFCYNMLPALFTAIATESSAATIPINMRCLEERNHVDPRVVRMIVPIGATINMNGTCVYLNIVAVFISYLHGTPVNAGQIATIMIMSISISIGVAAVPGGGGGNVEMAVLTSIGLPISDVYIIYTMYWVMARLRTAVNVIGDSFGCGVVEKLSASDLAKMAPEDEYLPTHNQDEYGHEKSRHGSGQYETANGVANGVALLPVEETAIV